MHSITIDVLHGTVTATAKAGRRRYMPGGYREVFVVSVIWVHEDSVCVIVDNEELVLGAMQSGERTAAITALQDIAGGWVEQREEPTPDQLRWLASGQCDYLTLELEDLCGGEA
jgi:hypothetical protein